MCLVVKGMRTHKSGRPPVADIMVEVRQIDKSTTSKRRALDGARR
jgi:hypothetical protein